MKNQYVGDISDFEKYSILRALQLHAVGRYSTAAHVWSHVAHR